MGYSYRELSMCSFHIMFIDKVCCICLFAAVLCGCYCVDYRFFAGFVLPVWLRSNVLKVGLCWVGLERRERLNSTLICVFFVRMAGPGDDIYYKYE